MKQKIVISIVLVLSCFSSVESRPSEIPKAVTGMTISSKFSGWGRDWCSHGEPVKDLYNKPHDCVIVGGEIHIVRVTNAISLANQSKVPDFDVLVPAAVDGTSSYGLIVNLEPAPADIAADTGVRYWAKDFGFIHFVCPRDNPRKLSSRCFKKLRKWALTTQSS